MKKTLDNLQLQSSGLIWTVPNVAYAVPAQVISFTISIGGSSKSLFCVKPERLNSSVLQFVLVLNLSVLRVPKQQLEPRLQVANIVQYSYCWNTLLASLNKIISMMRHAGTSVVMHATEQISPKDNYSAMM